MKRFLWEFLAIGSAGFIGAVLRWIIGSTLNRPMVPWGTLAINIVGSFALGWVMAVMGPRWEVSETARLAIAVGFLGTFTTFSSMMFETDARLVGGMPWVGVAYLVASVLLGLLAVRAGVMVGQLR